MGFTTGFLGGLTATYALLYLSIHLHRTNRQHQSLLLTQQKTLLTSLYDPLPPQFDNPAYEVRKAGLTEELKDRWNRELGNVVRNLQDKDWEEVRVKWETRAGNLWDNVRGSEVAKNVEGTIKETVAGIGSGSGAGAVDGVKEEVKKAAGGKRLLEL